MKKQVVVYGWYGPETRNIGDQLFERVFRNLLPDCDLFFTSKIPTQSKVKTDLLIFGGGSFLDQPIKASHYPDGLMAPTFTEPIFANGLTDPKCAKIAYIGVGAEGIHHDHDILLRHAKFAALRSNTNLPLVSKLCPDTMVIPDLVYSLANTGTHVRTPAQKKSILFCPNISCVPKYDSSAWMHNSWNHFKFEFAQALDTLIAQGYAIDYLPMCVNPYQIDDFAMAEINNLMHKGHLIRDVVYSVVEGIDPLIKLFASYGAVITQRFHGAILSELARTPYLCIAHHDKLRSTSFNEGIFTDFYASSKASILKAFDQTIALDLSSDLPIDQHSFDSLKVRLNQLLE